MSNALKFSKLHRLVITCGGTGGHFYPGLSIAREFQQAGGRVMLLLSGKHAVEQAATAQKSGIACEILAYMPSPSPRHPGSCWRFLKGWLSGERQAVHFLQRYQPDALLGMGSFASLPAIRAARRCKIPLFLHDGNARIGKANRYFSKWARHLGTAFPAVNAAAVHCPVSVIGMPIRPELRGAKEVTREEALARLNTTYHGNLRSELVTVLIFGGSQGARAINQSFSAALRQWNIAHPEQMIQAIHLAGAGEFESVAQTYQGVNFPALVLPTLAEMAWAYRLADFVVARSGGSSVAEIACFGKYACLIPYPYAAELHQDANADFLVQSRGAEKLDNALLLSDGDVAFLLISRWMSELKRYQAAGTALLSVAKPDAADVELETIDRFLAE